MGLLLAATSCVNDDSDLEWLIENDPKVKPIELKIDRSDLDEGEDIIVTDPKDEAYNDYWENSAWTTVIRVNYAPEGATVTGTTSRVKAEVNAGHVVVRANSSRVHIIATGECADGSLKVYSEYKFKLTLSGLTLTNPHGAVINNQCGKTFYLDVAPETVNRLEDGAGYTYVDDEDMKGVIFSEGQIAISGNGRLDIYSHGRHGIATDDYVRFRKGNNIYVNSTSGNGIRGKDGVYIDGSVINVETSASASKGITSRGVVRITGGRTTLITSGEPVVDAVVGDTTSCAALKCDSIIAIAGGVVNLKSTGIGGKGVNVHMRMEMTGGTLNVVTTGSKLLASPKGIKCDGEFAVSGGSLYSYSSHASPISAHPLTMAPTPAHYDPQQHVVVIKY